MHSTYLPTVFQTKTNCAHENTCLGQSCYCFFWNFYKIPKTREERLYVTPF